MTATDLLHDLADTLLRYRLAQSTERSLQDAIEEVLRREEIAYQREHRLSASDRPDFLVEGGLCVEVKVKGSASDARRQVERYAEHEVVKAILLVTTKAHHDLPTEIGGKPVLVVQVGGAFL